ncbi:MAG: protein kinase [Elusimicrobia bacterium]|nr:protein kinase [Elusimicrobiota bacterium]
MHKARKISADIQKTRELSSQLGLKSSPDLVKKYDEQAAQTKAFADETYASVLAGGTAADNPDKASLAAVTSIAASQLGDSKTALARAEKAVELAQAPGADPNLLKETLKVRAVSYAASGDYAKANEDAKRALKINPDDEAARQIELLTRGRSFGQMKSLPGKPPSPEIQGLIDQVRKPVVNRPQGFDSTVAHTKEAETDLKLGDYQRMYDEASKAIEKLPDNPKAYMQRAFAGLMLKNYDQVIKDAEAGLKLKPGSSSLLGLRAAAYNETGKPQKALDDAAKAVEDNPKDPFAWLQKGLAREKLNEGNDEYLSDIKNAAELDPGFEHFYTEALARRGQGNPAVAPVGPPQGSFLQRWVLPVAVVLLSLLVVGASLLKMFVKRAARPIAAAGPAEGRLLAGQFRIVRELGRGGMGVVYEAWDTRLERPVAIKKLTDGLRDQTQEAERLLKEAKTVASLRHDNIVVIHNAFEDAGEIYCVFEMVAGETLQDFLEARGRLSPSEALGFLAPICSALDYAHKLKIIHRDLKPANVMLENGKVKIMDFGIARRMKGGKGVTLTEMVIGTPAYMSPELVFGEVSPESDLYALGISAYQMLAGRLPFEGQGIQQDKLDGRFAPAASFVKGAPGIDAFFSRALTADRKNRFHSGAEFLAGFRKALA